MAIRPRDINQPHLSIEEFEQQARAAGWDEDTRVELLDGQIVWMNPVNDPHVAAVIRLTRLFLRRLSDDQASVSVQNPVTIPEYNEPVPDLTLVRPRADDYAAAKAGPEDILLIVEVADTTLARDLNWKAGIYAKAGIAEYWAVDLNNQRVHVHTAPQAGVYQHVNTIARGQRVAPLCAPNVYFTAKEIFG
jgi:hypothetical protein